MKIDSFIDDSSISEVPSQIKWGTSQATNYKYKIFASTWNVGGIVPQDDTCLEDFLNTKKSLCDIYVVGFQEVVPLTAMNVLRMEESEWVSTKWNSLIGAALNKQPSSTPSRPCHHESSKILEQKMKIYPMKEGSDIKMEDSLKLKFKCIIKKQMVGLLLVVWVRSDLKPYIHHQAVSFVGCGVLGCLGNKGAVSIRFFLHTTSFCFVCCHLASGGKEGDELRRNSDASEIFSRTRYHKGSEPFLPLRIFDHDRIILLGDLNYRISLSEDTTKRLVESKDWETLLKNDQLRMEISKGTKFKGWEEGAITFPPTYKYYPNSDEYYGCCLQRKKGEKRRSPAWCDRILWQGDGLHLENYDNGNSKLSDHRPVRANFMVEVIKVSRSFVLGTSDQGSNKVVY